MLILFQFISLIYVIINNLITSRECPISQLFGFMLCYKNRTIIVFFFFSFKAILRIFKEVHRLRMILGGLQLASSLHPNAWIIIIVIGAIKGT